jgi:hypothetical protein
VADGILEGADVGASLDGIALGVEFGSADRLLVGCVEGMFDGNDVDVRLGFNDGLPDACATGIPEGALVDGLELGE